MDRLADFMHGDIVRISSDTLGEMERIARSNSEKKRYRICLHDTPENRQHEMIICLTSDDYSRPHKHINMSETHIILKGRELVVLFEDDGNVRDFFVLDREGGEICYRINSDIYHMSIPLSDAVIEMETKGGPFRPESNVWANWAPDGQDFKQAKHYEKQIIEKCHIIPFFENVDENVNRGEKR